MINGTIFKEMIASGAANLSNHEEAINALNVFPVPDGDTGTNMSMTFNSGLDNVISSGADDLSTVANALSKGLLMGARGNSGVILSQIFRGFYKSIQNQSEIDALALAKAYDNGAYVAYKAVMKPVEGTILTVIREAAYYTLAYANANPDATVLDVQHYMVEQAKESLDNTDELLPILKQAGVKDSGGTGLLKVLEGFEAALKGEPFTKAETKSEVKKDILAFENDDNEDGYGYCTEFILRLNPQNIELCGVTNDFFPENNRHYITLHFFCHDFKGAPELMEPDKCVQWQWFDVDKLPENLFLSNKNFLKNHSL